MRATTAQLREIARLGNTWRPPRPGAKPITPQGIRAKALEIFHEEGHPAALAYLAGRRPGSKGLAGYWGEGQGGASEGQRARFNFDRYVHFAADDHREVVEANLDAPARLGPHELAMTVDVVLFDPDGYAARLLNWSKADLDRSAIELLAAAAVVCLDEHLGAGLTVEVAVWDLEHRRRRTVDAKAARARTADLSALLDVLPS